MRLRLVMIVAAALSLSGCWWAGPAFYTGNPADAAPLKPGLYQITLLDESGPAPGDKPSTIRLAWRPDGSVSVTPTDPKKRQDGWTAVAVRFAMPGRDLWVTQTMAKGDAPERVYGLIELHGDMLWAMPAIDCDSTVDIVRAAGGDVTSGSGTDAIATNRDCLFKDRASFEQALRAYIATKPHFISRIKFKRIGP